MSGRQASTTLCARTVLAMLLALAVSPARAQDEVRTDRVRYELAAPKNRAHDFIHMRLTRMDVLPRLARFLSPFRLPKDVTIVVRGCDGEVDAYYDSAVITICYEYLEYIQMHAPRLRTADGIWRREAIVGPSVDLVLHEMGHAVFELLKIPVFGREEDAADLFAAYIQLHASPQDARALITGVAFLGRKETEEAMQVNLELKHFAKEHGLPGQRYFNVLCVAYGFDPVLFADAVSLWNLPPERAAGCAAEYAQLDLAFTALIKPHLDPDLLAEVRAANLLRFGPSG
jgi:hypothetical protein